MKRRLPKRTEKSIIKLLKSVKNLKSMMMSILEKRIILVSLVLFLFFVGLYWLAMGILALGAILWCIRYSNFLPARRVRKNNGLLFFVACSGAFGLAILTRVFLVEFYTIPSDSMEGSLFPGDRVVMSKLHYGPKLPRSPYEIPFVDMLMTTLKPKQAWATNDSELWTYKRARGYTKIHRKDVVIFDPPHDPIHHYIKRCVGLPGDTLQLKEAMVYINSQKQIPPKQVRHAYALFGKKEEQILNMKEYRQHQERNGNSLQIKNFPITLFSKTKSDSITWSTNEWGPLVIPKKGMYVTFTKTNWILYQTILKQYEGVDLEKNDTDFYINGEPAKGFQFQNDYYFMLGDNRHDSLDSRYWGLVSEKNVLGKAVLVLFSTDAYGKNWTRFLHGIR